MEKRKSFFDYIWDFSCIISGIGIWPRFIEPKIISTTKISLPIKDLPSELESLKILQFSDFHFQYRTKQSFINRLIKKIDKLKPDLIVFTGDLLCYSKLQDSVRLKKFLNSLGAPYGCYAILGNHDYEKCVEINKFGEYDTFEKRPSFFVEGFRRLFLPKPILGKVTERAKKIKENTQLVSLFKETPFKLLHNETTMVKIKNSAINICGMGEYILGRFLPGDAYKNYDEKFPGLVLAHNPDCVPLLSPYPGQVVLCGHTHGGQINFPFVWNRITLIENTEFKRGLKRKGNKWIYINRGIGSSVPFRLFSPPELLILTLERAK